MSYVMDEVRGMPDDQLKIELQKLRQVAASRGEDQ